MSEVEKKINADGDIYYYKKGTKILHREDGPAIEYADGSKMWYFNGNRHREDGPAIESPKGYRMWYANDLPHREDGPALIREDGTENWYLNGEEVTEEEVMSDDKDYQVGGSHYAIQYIQPWDYMEACMSEEEFKGYLRGNVIKYVSRYDKKGGLQDIDKALHYLEKLRSLL